MVGRYRAARDIFPMQSSREELLKRRKSVLLILMPCDFYFSASRMRLAKVFIKKQERNREQRFHCVSSTIRSSNRSRAEAAMATKAMKWALSRIAMKFCIHCLKFDK